LGEQEKGEVIMTKSKRRAAHAGFGTALFTVAIISGFSAIPATAQEKNLKNRLSSEQ